MSNRPPGGPAAAGAKSTKSSKSTKSTKVHTAQAGPSRPKPAADPAREVAYELLREVATHDVYANLALPTLLTTRQVDSRDAALATELGYGTLRMTGTLDAIITHLAGRPTTAIDPPVLDLLRLGVYQLLCTRVPPHAAVATTVELAHRSGNGRASGFVNAVLRKVGAHDWDGWAAQLTAGQSETDRIAIRTAHPRWIVEAVSRSLAGPVGATVAETGTGTVVEPAAGDVAELEAALLANNVRPSTHLVAWPGLALSADLAAESGGEVGPFSPYAVRMSGGDPANLVTLREGRGAVQDEGSQLCAVALTEVPIDGSDAHWLDLCAGPGGKAALLAALGAERGARLVANELHPHRAGLVKRALGPWPTEIRVGDARLLTSDVLFDRVLVDAPCTGLGALRRRPEARWRRSEQDLAVLTVLQAELLAAALQLTRAGGVIAYVTCSPHPQETSAVVEKVLAESGESAQLLDAREWFEGVEQLGEGPYVQLWPHRHGTDAMFCALIRR